MTDNIAIPLLPDEIAELIEEVLSPRSADHEDKAKRVATTLRMLAQENERLKEKAEYHMQYGGLADGRIVELEAERDSWRERYNEVAENHKDRMADQRDAIRTKTIEECAEAAEDACDRESIVRGDIIGNAIRALAQTDESKTESGE